MNHNSQSDAAFERSSIIKPTYDAHLILHNGCVCRYAMFDRWNILLLFISVLIQSGDYKNLHLNGTLRILASFMMAN